MVIESLGDVLSWAFRSQDPQRVRSW